ncbi:MAG: methylated-DNA--[protein]-cysteine S-methyltransferase [Nitrospinota bacterium]|nr:MAG: methylated-DNA--[protein]-cysteine S-methyltransferase [Nitrospinota bacterium]
MVKRSAESPGQPNFYDYVYRVVRQVPWGKVTTYGRVAAILGHPRAARAVGYALHNLSSDTDVPWHRVINAQGMISARCDLHRPEIQRVLLEAEGIIFDTAGKVDLQRFLWEGPSAEEVEHYRYRPRLRRGREEMRFW